MLASAIVLTLLMGSGKAEAQTHTPSLDAGQTHPASGQTSGRRADDAPSDPDGPDQKPTSQQTDFLDSSGRPLPPEVVRQLREQMASDAPSKTPTPTPAPYATSEATSPRSAARNTDGEITVIGRRPRGSVVGDIPPQETLSPLDIRAFGANNVGELLANLQSQVRSIRGRGDDGPVTLLNGRRISDFAEVARIPTEAIERMEVFPEELALRYGYRADQKVVNIVTFERFRSRTAQVGYALPTEGGRNTATAAADYFSIMGDTRYSLGGDYSSSGLLRESDREVLQLPGVPEIARFRSLLPGTERLTLNGLISRNLFGDVSGTLNGRIETNEAETLLGVGTDGPLRRDQDTRSLHVGTTLNGRTARWIWSLTANYDRAVTEIGTDVGTLGRTRDEARSVNSLADADLVFSGPVVELPAGPVSATLRGGLATRDFSSRSSLGEVEQRAQLSRNRGALQASLDIPVTGRRAGRAGPLGTVSVNVNAEIEQLSDFGSLRTYGYGLQWSPVDALSVIASVTNEEGAPTVEQLGGPLVVTPNIRVFDFARREVVDVTRVFGGNPDLRSDDRRVLRLGLIARPLSETDLTLTADYVGTRIENPIVFFPIITPEIEAALPDRFTRDPDGRLRRIDSRPLNFRRAEQEQLRFGISFTRPLGPVPAGAQTGRFFSSESDMRRTLPPGVKVVVAQPGSPMARRLENMTSRLFFNLYTTWYLKDEILVREGLAKLDLLDGSATEFRGGRRRHEVEFQAGVFKRGLGARLTANWQSGTRVQGLGGAAGNLRFSDFGTLGVSLFANLADYFGSSSPVWLKGTRLTMGVTNLSNTRPQVQDDAGFTPLSYQPAYLDPVGRSLNISLRKVF